MSYRYLIGILDYSIYIRLIRAYDPQATMEDIAQTPISQLNYIVEDMLAEFDVANNYIIDQDQIEYTRNQKNKLQINIEYWLRLNYEEDQLAYYDATPNVSGEEHASEEPEAETAETEPEV